LPVDLISGERYAPKIIEMSNCSISEAHMKAYYVHDSRKALDHIIIPERDKIVPVGRSTMEEFIGVSPKFDQMTGSSLNGLEPQNFGTVIATRDDQGDVCIENAVMWQERMQSLLGTP
jgi:hypothetical protein